MQRTRSFGLCLLSGILVAGLLSPSWALASQSDPADTSSAAVVATHSSDDTDRDASERRESASVYEEGNGDPASKDPPQNKDNVNLPEGSDGKEALDSEGDPTAGEAVGSPDNKTDGKSPNSEDSSAQKEGEGMGNEPEGASPLASAAPLAEQGPHADGWADENGERYYYVAGERVKGSLFVDGGWYRFDLSDGHMLTGWQDIDGKRYFYGDDGAMLFKNQFLGGSWYWFDMNEGFMWTGSANIYGRWYRYDLSDGHMLTGSQYIDGHWYRYEPVEGYMLFGSQYIDGHWYWYDLAAGMMLTGSQYIYGDWYWYDLAAGYMHTGFTYIYGKWYWYDLADGRMLFGNQNIYGTICHFHEQAGYLTDGDITVYPYSLDQAVANQVACNSSYTSAEYRSAMNPGGVSYGSSGFNQFMRLDGGYSGVTASQIDAFIEKNCLYQEKVTGRRSTLRGLGSAIVDVSKSTGVNEAYILAHAILESGWGCSVLATGNVVGYQGYYNFFGIGAYDTDPLNGGAALAKLNAWTTPALAIQGGAQWIAKNYITRAFNAGAGYYVRQNTLYKMRFAPGLNNTWHQYATSLTWPRSIASLISNVYIYAGQKSVAYDVPLYT